MFLENLQKQPEFLLLWLTNCLVSDKGHQTPKIKSTTNNQLIVSIIFIPTTLPLLLILISIYFVFSPASLVSVSLRHGKKRKRIRTLFERTKSPIVPKRYVSELKSENKRCKARTAPLTQSEIKFLRHLVVE